MSKHAEIAGAGIAGLTAATALALRGWTVRVHERGHELREIGAGIYLWENAVAVLEQIGAHDDVVSNAERVDGPELRDHRGRVLQREWLQDGRLYTVPRQHLHAALARAAASAGVEVVTGSMVESASPHGELRVADGSTYEADLVLGADGVFSRVRDSLGLLKEMRHLGDGGGRHMIERTDDDPVNAVWEEWNGGRRIGVVPCSATQTYIFLCCRADDEAGTRQDPFERDTWIESFPKYRSQLERIRDNSEGRWAPFFEVVVSSWSKGRAALVGDAAHAMPPNLGQAACTAMMNVLALAQALDGNSDVLAGLAAWERSERKLVDHVQRLSTVYGVVGTKWPRPLLDLRSALVRGLGVKPVQQWIQSAALHVPQLDAPATS